MAYSHTTVTAYLLAQRALEPTADGGVCIRLRPAQRQALCVKQKEYMARLESLLQAPESDQRQAALSDTIAKHAIMQLLLRDSHVSFSQVRPMGGLLQEGVLWEAFHIIAAYNAALHQLLVENGTGLPAGSTGSS